MSKYQRSSAKKRMRQLGKKTPPSATDATKVRQKLRRATRGAIKDLRAEAHSLARLQEERLKKERKERDAKTKKILHQLQTQESEYKKRTKKKF